jgi:hypothetical protein
MQVDVPAVSIGTAGRLYMNVTVTSCHGSAHKVSAAKSGPRIPKYPMATGGVRRRRGQRQQREAMRSGPRGDAAAHAPLDSLPILDRGLA